MNPIKLLSQVCLLSACVLLSVPSFAMDDDDDPSTCEAVEALTPKLYADHTQEEVVDLVTELKAISQKASAPDLKRMSVAERILQANFAKLSDDQMFEILEAMKRMGYAPMSAFVVRWIESITPRLSRLTTTQLTSFPVTFGEWRYKLDWDLFIPAWKAQLKNRISALRPDIAFNIVMGAFYMRRPMHLDWALEFVGDELLAVELNSPEASELGLIYEYWRTVNNVEFTRLERFHENMDLRLGQNEEKRFLTGRVESWLKSQGAKFESPFHVDGTIPVDIYVPASKLAIHVDGRPDLFLNYNGNLRMSRRTRVIDKILKARGYQVRHINRTSI